MTAWRRRAAPQQDETRAQRALARAEGMLLQYRRDGMTTVSIEDVLLLLGTDPGAVPERQRPEPPRDPLTDPLTGAMWPGPAGSVPPGPQVTPG